MKESNYLRCILVFDEKSICIRGQLKSSYYANGMVYCLVL